MFLNKRIWLGTAMLLLIQNGVQAEECCKEKRVGSVSYSLLAEDFAGSLHEQCLNTCVYTEKGKSSPKFCFAQGDLPTECLSKASPETPGVDCNFDPTEDHLMDGGQRFRFNVEIPFVEVGQGPLVVEMSGKDSENAEVSLMGLGLAFNAKGSEKARQTGCQDDCDENDSCDCGNTCCSDGTCKQSCAAPEYTSDLLRPVLPGNYTIEVTPASGEWESPPTIVSIRLRHGHCTLSCPSTCPADEFEPGKLRGGCNTTAVLQNDGQSYVAQLSGLQGLERIGSLTIDFYQNGASIQNTPVSSCDGFEKARQTGCQDNCDENGSCDCGNTCCSDYTCKSDCNAPDTCLSNTPLPLGVRELIVKNPMLQANGTLSDEGARWSTPPIITAYYVDGGNLCDEGVPPCCQMNSPSPNCTLCRP